jgi:ParB family chromosome partitioning protein
MNKKALGKGLGALISASEDISQGVKELKINEIEPNMNQPRKHFNDEKLNQLAESIKEHGVVQPIIVRRENNTYSIIAGERRWRASRLAGYSTIPAIIKDGTDKQVMEIALIENIQREDLNPIEEAEAFERLINEHNLTQEELSKSIGKSRPAIANTIRLLSLCDEVRTYLINEDLSSGHARTLLAIENPELQRMAAEEIIKKEMSVRETESYIKKIQTKAKVKKIDDNQIENKSIEETIQKSLGTKVKFLPGKNKGKIVIEYYSNDELERLMEIFSTNSEKKQA